LPKPFQIVDSDRIVDAVAVGRGLDICDVVLETELRRMRANGYQTPVLVSVRPGPDIGQCPKAVDAGIGPEIDKNDLAAKTSIPEGRRVEPLLCAKHRQLGRRGGVAGSNGARRCHIDGSTREYREGDPCREGRVKWVLHRLASGSRCVLNGYLEQIIAVSVRSAAARHNNVFRKFLGETSYAARLPA
jgi:hypothetical protein